MLSESEVCRAIGLIFVTLVGVIGALAAIHLLSTTQLWTAVGASWIQAVGSTGAIGVAIWLATRESKRRYVEASALARLTAASMYFQQLHNESNARNALNSIQSALRKDIYLIGGIERVNVFIDNAVQNLKEVIPWTAEEMLPLASLPNDCAVQLAAAQGRVTSTLTLLAKIKTHLNNQATFFQALRDHEGILATAVDGLTQTTETFGRLINIQPSN
jgi:hypothetical protein